MRHELAATGWWLFGLGVSILLFTAGLLALTTLSLWLGIVVPASAVPVAAIFTAIVVALWARSRFSHRPMWAATSILTAAAAIVVGSLLVGGAVLDTSFDGQWYHQEAMVQMADGWNPVYGELTPSDLGDEQARLQINGYPKASWLWGLALYRFTGGIEYTKALSFPLMAAAFAITAAALLGFGGLSRRVAILTALAAAANPVAITQTLNSQLDGDLVSLFLIAGASLVLAARDGGRDVLAALVMAIAIAINLKLTAAPYLAIIVVGSLLLMLVATRRPVPRRVLVAIARGFLIGGLVLGFHPYVTNLWRHGHPLYPIMGPDKDVLIQPSSVNRLTLAARSVFSPSRQFGRDRPVEESLSENPLKMPFTVTEEEIAAFRYPDVRGGGLGPLYGGLLIVAAALLIALGFAGRRWLVVGGLAVIPLVVTVLILPHPWFARLVPQGWLIPLVLIPVVWAAGGRAARLLAWTALITALINVSLVTVGYGPATLRHSALIKHRLQQLRRLPQPIALNLSPFQSNRARLAESGLLVTRVRDQDRRLQVLLGRHQPRITRVTPQPEAGVLYVAWEEVPEATHYTVAVLVPAPAGPGGGALSVVSRTVLRSPAIVPVGNGECRVLISSCNLAGCGPPAISGPILVSDVRRPQPIFGHPEDGTTISSRRTLLSWLPVESGVEIGGPGQRSSYLVEVVDAVTGSPVATSFTQKIHLPVQLPPEGEWLARVAVQELEPSLDFHEIRFRTGAATTPTMVAPIAGMNVPEGSVGLGWTAVPGATAYEFFVTAPGRRTPAARGTTPGVSSTVTLAAENGAPTLLHAIARACYAKDGCRSGIGWGLWSSAGGIPPLAFTVIPARAP